MREHIVFVISDLGSGGAQQVAIRMINRLAELQRDCFVITLDDGEEDFALPSPNVTLVRLGLTGRNKTPVGALWCNFKRVCALRRALFEISPSVVVSFIGPTNCLTILASIRRQFKLVVSERNDPSRQSFGRFWDTCRKVLYRFSDIVSVNSMDALIYLRRYVPEHKLYYLPNPIKQIDEDIKVKPMHEREKKMVSVGRLHPQKNYPVLINAISKIRQDIPGWQLCIVGIGERELALRAQVRELGLENVVRFLGRVERPYDILCNSSIFLMPSLHEGQPNALLEAMAAGCAPIVSSAIPDIQYIMEHGKCGLVCDPTDQQTWAKAILELVEDKEKRERFAGCCSSRSKAWELSAVEAIWHDILKQ